MGSNFVATVWEKPTHGCEGQESTCNHQDTFLHLSMTIQRKSPPQT